MMRHGSCCRRSGATRRFFGGTTSMAETETEATRADESDSADERVPVRADSEDPVLAAMRVAEDVYRSERGSVGRIETALADTRYQLTVAERRLEESQGVSQELRTRLSE